MTDFEDLDDALREAIRQMGGHKRVGPQLRPELPIEQAAGWLRDCLNPERREKLSPAQVLLVLRMAREAGYHGAMDYVTTAAGYKQAEPAEPRDIAAQLQRQFIDAVAQLEHVQRELAKLQQPLAPRLVREAA